MVDRVVGVAHEPVGARAHDRRFSQRDDAVRPVAPERGDDPVAHDLQQQIEREQRPQDRRAGGNQEEDRGDPRQVRDGDDGIVVAPRLAAALRDQAARVALRVELLEPALHEHEKGRNLRRSEALLNHRVLPGLRCRMLRGAEPGVCVGSNRRKRLRTPAGQYAANSLASRTIERNEAACGSTASQPDRPCAPDPSPPPILARAGELLAGYDVLFCDVWGVLHDGHRAFADACDALLRFRARGGTVILVSNAPVPRERVAAMLDARGVAARGVGRHRRLGRDRAAPHRREGLHAGLLHRANRPRRRDLRGAQRRTLAARDGPGRPLHRAQ